MMRVTLYTRQPCPLCDEARQALQALQPEHPHQLVEVDVDQHPALAARHGEHVPVIEAGPYTLRAPFSPTELKVTLASAQSAAAERPALSERQRRRIVRADRVVLAFARRWLAVFNLLLGLYVGVPFLAPILMRAGAEQPALWIYRAYSPLCHQLAFRSWFLFGEQAAYARHGAGDGSITYRQATGLNEDDLWAARNFVGDARLGFKVALCQRDVAIYAGMALGGMVFGLMRRRLRPIPIALWVVIGVAPIAIDGGSQFIGALPFLGALARESSPLLRSLTGGLFGVMNVWMAYPYIEESMGEVIGTLVPKLAAVDAGARRASAAPPP